MTRTLRPMSFRAQISIAFGAVVVALIAVLAVVLGDLQAESLRRSAGDALEVVANNAQRALAAGLDRRLNIVRTLAATPALWEQGLESREAAAALAQQQRISAHLAWMGVADTSGIVRTSTGDLLKGADVRARPWFGRGLQGDYVGDVHDAVLLAKLLPTSASGEPQRFVDFAAPLRVNGHVVGVLALHGSWEWARSVIASQLPEDPKSLAMELFIVDRQGKVIYAPPARDAQDVKVGHSLAAMLRQPMRSAVVAPWPDQVDYLTASATVQAKDDAADLGWTVIARLPKDVAYAPVRAALWRVVLFSIVAALVAMLVAWLVAGSISRPLSEIEKAAQTVLEGKDGATIPAITTSAELQGLSTTLIGMTQTLQHRVREHTLLARHDPLTTLLNRRGFEERFEQAIAQAHRRETPLSVLAIDIDHFKQVNDLHGHHAGDRVLFQLAEQLRAWFRQTDCVARMGGEEFIVLLPDTELRAASALAEAFVDEVARTDFHPVGHVTVSCGASQVCDPHDGRAALRRADQALYRAKARGRNRTVTLAEDLVTEA